MALVVAGIVGSRPRIPAPFGLAANGLVVYDDGSQIVALKPGEIDAHPLLSGPGMDSRPSVSLDGQRVAFLREQGTKTALMVANMDGSGARELAVPIRPPGSYMAGEAPAWNPDSRRIAITILDTRETDPVARIWIVDADDDHVTEFLPLSLFSVQYPAWSPAGDRIAFLGEPTRHPEDFIYVAAPDGTDLELLSKRASGPEEGFLQLPRWSPDGKHIAVHYGAPERPEPRRPPARDRPATRGSDRRHGQGRGRSRLGRLMAVDSPIGAPRRRLSVAGRRARPSHAAARRSSPPSAAAADSLAWSPDGTQITALICQLGPARLPARGVACP